LATTPTNYAKKKNVFFEKIIIHKKSFRRRITGLRPNHGKNWSGTRHFSLSLSPLHITCEQQTAPAETEGFQFLSACTLFPYDLNILSRYKVSLFFISFFYACKIIGIYILHIQLNLQPPSWFQ